MGQRGVLEMGQSGGRIEIKESPQRSPQKSVKRSRRGVGVCRGFAKTFV